MRMSTFGSANRAYRHEIPRGRVEKKLKKVSKQCLRHSQFPRHSLMTMTFVTTVTFVLYTTRRDSLYYLRAERFCRSCNICTEDDYTGPTHR